MARLFLAKRLTFVMVVGVFFCGHAFLLEATALTIDAKHLTSLKNFTNYRRVVFSNPAYIGRISSLQILFTGSTPPQIDWRFLKEFSKTNLKQLYIDKLNLTTTL